MVSLALDFEALSQRLANGRIPARLPCPDCGPHFKGDKAHDPCLAVWPGYKGGISCYCNRCQSKHFLRPNEEDRPLKREYTPSIEIDQKVQEDRVRDRWNPTHPTTSCPLVERYLLSRGLDLYMPFDAGVYLWSPDIRGELAEEKGQDAMCALIRDHEGRPSTIQFTLLDSNGRKVSRRFMSGMSLPRGGAIRLSKLSSSVLGIAEGVETALSAKLLFGIPVWAATSATMLEHWKPPTGIHTIVVYGDNDENGVGQDAAKGLADRLKGEGYKVRLRIPDKVGDWNDVLMERQNGIRSA